MIRTCNWCGKEFEPKYAQSRYCCNECRYEAEKDRWRERAKHKGYPHRRKRNRGKSSLDKNIAKAHKLGMSYGQYKAMEYIEQTRIKLS